MHAGGADVFYTKTVWSKRRSAGYLTCVKEKTFASDRARLLDVPRHILYKLQV